MSPSPPAVRYRLRGGVSVEIGGASDSRLRAFERWAPASRDRGEGEADLVLRIVSGALSKERDRPVRGHALRACDAGLIIRRAGVTFVLPLDRIGLGLEVECRGGLPPPSVLRPLVNLLALARGSLPVHAAGLEQDGGVLVSGSSGAGKTSMMLAGLAEGARFLCSEWALIDPAGGRIHGANEPVRIRSHHLATWPELADLPGAASVVRARLLGAVGGLLGRWGQPVVRRAYVDVQPAALSKEPPLYEPVPLRRLMVLLRRGSVEGCGAAMTPADVVAQMVRLAMHDYREVVSLYGAHRFAFPDRPSPFLERLEETLAEHFVRALAGVTIQRIALPASATAEKLRDSWRKLGSDLPHSSVAAGG